jgi:hypothetical protein
MENVAEKIEVKTAWDLKDILKALVEVKVGLTQERREYKASTREHAAEIEKVCADWMERTATKNAEAYKAWSARLRWFQTIDTKRWDQRHSIRHHHLAYGFLRGREYLQLEAKVGEDNAPSARQVADIVTDYGGDASGVESWLTRSSTS